MVIPLRGCVPPPSPPPPQPLVSYGCEGLWSCRQRSCMTMIETPNQYFNLEAVTGYARKARTKRRGSSPHKWFRAWTQPALHATQSRTPHGASRFFVHAMSVWSVETQRARASRHYSDARVSGSTDHGHALQRVHPVPFTTKRNVRGVDLFFVPNGR